MFHGEPVIGALWSQVVIQFLIKWCMLSLEINFPGLSEGVFGVKALLDNPEGMFKADKDGCPCNSKKLYI